MHDRMELDGEPGINLEWNWEGSGWNLDQLSRIWDINWERSSIYERIGMELEKIEEVIWEFRDETRKDVRAETWI